MDLLSDFAILFFVLMLFIICASHTSACTANRTRKIRWGNVKKFQDFVINNRTPPFNPQKVLALSETGQEFIRSLRISKDFEASPAIFLYGFHSLMRETMMIR